MLYACRNLYLASGDVLHLQVVEVAGGVAVACSPFEVERQSMLWVEEAFLSPLPNATVVGDFARSAQSACVDAPLFLYSCEFDLQPSAPVNRLG